MNMLDMMNKLTALSEAKSADNDFSGAKGASAPDKSKTITHKGGVKTADDKGVKHQGKYGNEYQGDDEDEAKNKAAKPTGEKRGRGRPRKDADAAGNVSTPDWSGFGAKKDVKLKPWDKKKTTTHKMDAGNKNQKKDLKDWIEHLDRALNESEQVSIAPAQANTQVIKQGDKTLGTVTNPQLAQQIKQSIGKGEMTMAGSELGEDKNHMGETEYHGYYKWRVACRKAGATEFVGDKDIDEGHDDSGQAVGEWDGVVGTVYGDAHKANPAQDPYDQDDPAPMEEGAGGYMINGKEVDLNSIQMGGVHGWDYPDLTDAYVESAEFTDGTPLNDDELDELTNDGDLMNQKAHDSLHEGKKAKPDFLDKDKDGNKKEPFKKAAKDAKKPVEEGKDEGKPGKNFAKIAKSAGKEYGSKAAGERVAGAVRNKLAKQGKLEESKMSELDLDLKDPKCTDVEFKKKYKKTKAEMRAAMKDKKPVKEATDTETKDSAGKVKSWKHEGDWKKSEKKDPRGKVTNLSDKARKETEKKTVKEGRSHDLDAARLAGKSHGLKGHAHCGKNYEDMEEARCYHDGYKEGLDECYGQSVMDEGEFSQDYFTANKPSPIRQAAQVPVKQVQTPWSRDPIAALTDRIHDKFTSPKADVQFESWSSDLDNLLSEGMNVTANTGLGDGPDSVTISATDEDAQKLLAIVKSAGLGMFAGDEATHDGESSPMSVQSQDNPEADIEVVGDHDGMLDLMRKMSGQSSAPAQSNAEVEVDEEETPDQREFQVAEEDEESGDSASDQASGDSASDQASGDSLAASADQSGGAQDSGPEEPEAALEGEEAPDGDAKQATEKLEKVHAAWSAAGDGEEEPADAEEEEKEEVDEAFANGADDTFESDIEYMQNVISGGVNGRKRTQSVGNPVTIASTPMRESTDLLKDWVKLSGL